MKNKLIIRADSSRTIGLGHQVRCLSLAYMLSEDFDVSFIAFEIPDFIQRELRACGCKIKIIERESIFMNQCLEEGSVVVLDGYHFNELYQKKIKSRRCTLVCIDDMYQQRFYADVIINHAPGIKKEYYQVDKNPIFALGPDYALLRPSFLKAALNKINEAEKHTLFICFGGSDVENKTFLSLREAVKTRLFKKIRVVTGSHYHYISDLVLFVKNHPEIEHYHSVNEQEMVDLMTCSESAVVPASGILFEALASGCKVISGRYIDNQSNVQRGFQKLGAIIDSGVFESDSLHQAFNELKNFEPVRVIDGKSPERMQKIFSNCKDLRS